MRYETTTRIRILRAVKAEPTGGGLRLLGISGRDWAGDWNTELLLLIGQAYLSVRDDGRTGVRLFLTERGATELALDDLAYDRYLTEHCSAPN